MAQAGLIEMGVINCIIVVRKGGSLGMEDEGPPLGSTFSICEEDGRMNGCSMWSIRRVIS